MFFKKWASFILKYRKLHLFTILIATLFMAFKATKVDYEYTLLKIVPQNDKDLQIYKTFKATFGEDGDFMVIGTKDKQLYQYDNFTQYTHLVKNLNKLNGVKNIISLPVLSYIKNNSKEKRFDTPPLFEPFPSTQEKLDSLLSIAFSLKFYEGRVFSKDKKANSIIVTLKEEYINSILRVELVNQVLHLCEDFSSKTGIELYYGGLPYTRTMMASIVKQELKILLFLSVLVIVIILYILFRSFRIIIATVILIAIIILFLHGYMVLFEYKINLLSVLLPPILIIIAIPNFIYLIGKYHSLYLKHKDKNIALMEALAKIIFISFLANLTTAIGFGVLIFTNIPPIQEFGTIATVGVLTTFLISIFYLPCVLSYMPKPKYKHILHVKYDFMQRIITRIIFITKHHSRYIYLISGIIVIISIYGVLQLKTMSRMMDDFPENSNVMEGLHFFENNFDGIVPLEITIDTKEKRGIRKLKNIILAEKIENYLDSFPQIAKPISIVTLLKAGNQSFYDSEEQFKLPNKSIFPIIVRNILNSNQNGKTKKSIEKLTNEDYSIMRISTLVKDLGSIELDELVNQKIKPYLHQLLKNEKAEAEVTGTTLLYIKGSHFLIQNLIQSLVLALIIITLIICILFKNIRIIFVALIPNIIPLLFTAGIMGWFDFPLKASTILIFSVTFGISVDDTIHFLGKFYQEKKKQPNISICIENSLRDIGKSMIYTSIVLLFGFLILMYSNFLGIYALGILTATTLLIAMLTNIILAPCLLTTYYSMGKQKIK